MRIAIAEWMGWTVKRNDWAEPMGYNDNLSGDLKVIPNYPLDLNAMHEAEKKLIEANNGENMIYSKWLSVLQSICGGTFNAFHATSSQRSEALCHVIVPERFQ